MGNTPPPLQEYAVYSFWQYVPRITPSRVENVLSVYLECVVRDMNNIKWCEKPPENHIC